MKKLERDFYMRDTLTVARELLGKYIVHETAKGKLIGKIVEAEAYLGVEDKAAHSYGGRRTPRNEAMYGIGGRAYVFVIYGMYDCFNVVTGEKDAPTAVLIRAVEPYEGLEQMAENRFGKGYEALSNRQKKDLTNGPGKLCLAMEIKKDMSGMDLCGDSSMYLAEGPSEDFEIKTSPRINIDYSEEYVDKPWRFFIENNKYVSKK